MKERSFSFCNQAIFLSLFLTGFFGLAQANPATQALSVEVAGLIPNKGNIIVGVCSREKFMTPDCEVSKLAPAEGEWKQVIQMDAPTEGLYAIQVFQDVNGDFALDMNRFGAPREPVGFSNNPKTRFGPPSFEDAAIDLAEIGGKKITVNLE